MLDSLENKLGEKITSQQELESEIRDTKIRLDYTRYEINNLKDAIITEYEKSLEKKQQEIDELKESNICEV